MKSICSENLLAFQSGNVDRIINQAVANFLEEVKGNLASIGDLALIAEHLSKPEEIHHCLRLIQHCTEKMISIINEIEVSTEANSQAEKKKIQNSSGLALDNLKTDATICSTPSAGTLVLFILNQQIL